MSSTTGLPSNPDFVGAPGFVAAPDFVAAPGFVAAVERAMAVLQAVGAARSATMADVARAAGLDRAGARRLLLTLSALGYVRQAGRQWSLAPRVLGLGYHYLSALPFWPIAQPVLDEVAAGLGESCSVGVLDGADIVFVLRVPSRRLLPFDPGIGGRLPAYVHSIGRALLAALPDAELDAYLAHATFQPLTPHTVADAGALRAALLRDRARGWSFAAEQYEHGMCGIAVPVLDRDGRAVAAVNASLIHDADAERRAVADVLPRLRVAAGRLGQAQ